MRKASAVITVFFSLLSILFLALILALAEGVRVRGARAHCADLTAASSWSAFSEYENCLLDHYDLFGLDLSGGGAFSVSPLEARLKSYLDENTDVRGSLGNKLPGLVFDPFQVQAQSAEVTDYALLSDQKGSYFYQQVVDYMHQTGWIKSLSALSETARSAEKSRKLMDRYQETRRDAGKKAADLKKQTDQLKTQAQEEQADSQSASQSPPPEKEPNPLWAMLTLAFKNPLTLVCGRKQVSSRKVPGRNLLSKRHKNSGKLKLPMKRGGVTDDLLFRAYLTDHFPDWHADRTDLKIAYQTEYILFGAASDKKNLKKAVTRLLLLREAYNDFYLQKDPASAKQVTSLAALFLGWTGNAALIESFRQLLMVYWAYGESLMDVRILMHGGKVPLVKTDADWHVPLARLAELEVLLAQVNTAQGRGASYSDYLRLLLCMQPVSTQKKRALDLLELNLQTTFGMPSFRADRCLIAMKDTCTFSIRPVFSSVPRVFLGAASSDSRLTVQGAFSY